MRVISGTLSAAISAQTRRPYVTLSAEDHINHLAQTVATSGNSDGWNDLCVASDGSIIRVSLTRGGNAFQQSFQWQRVTDPTQASQWTTWNTFAGGSGNMFQDGGCCISNTGGTLRAFAQRGTGGNTIWQWTSTNNGQSWSASPISVVSPPAGALTKGLASAGNNDCFFIYDVAGGENIGCSFFSGSWSALAAWTLAPINYGQGLAVAWLAGSSTYYVVYSDGFALHECNVNSSGTAWIAMADLAAATSNAISRISPRLSLFDGLYNLLCIESDSGTMTGTSYSYPRLRQSADLVHWSTGSPLYDFTSQFGVGLLKCTPPSTTRARYVAASMALVELGTDFQQSDATQYVNLSAPIVEYRREDQIGKPAKLTIVLDNAGSALTSSVASYGTTYAPIGLNTTLVLSEGYLTGTPPITPEAVNVARYRVRQIAFERAPGHNQIRLEAEDASRLLDQVNRYQAAYTNQTLAYLLREICARAGLFSVVLPATTQMSTSVGTFVLHAGQRYRQALDELCRVGWLEYFLDQNETMQFRELASSDSSIWSYTPEIEVLTIGSDDLRANHVIVTGKPPGGSQVGLITNGEAYDALNMHVVGLERLAVELDPKLATPGLCASKASFILQQEQRNQVAHSITVPANPALQLLDVIQLNDQPPNIGTGKSATARVYRDEVRFLPEKAEYSHTLWMEGL